MRPAVGGMALLEQISSGRHRAVLLSSPFPPPSAAAMRLSRLVPLVAALLAAAAVRAAESPAPPPSNDAPRASPSYQERMKACHKQAQGRKGMARCEFLRQCLHGDGAAAGKTEGR